MSNLGANIRTRRESLGMTRGELGVKAGVSRVSIHYYETGQKAPGLSTAAAIAKALDCKVDDLIGRDE